MPAVQFELQTRARTVDLLARSRNPALTEPLYQLYENFLPPLQACSASMPHGTLRSAIRLARSILAGALALNSWLFRLTLSQLKLCTLWFAVTPEPVSIEQPGYLVFDQAMGKS